MGTALLLALTLCLPGRALALVAGELVPAGFAVGIDLQTDGVMIVGLSDVETSDGGRRPAEEAGLRVGDLIKQVGSRHTGSAADFLTAMAEADGEAIPVTVEREGEEMPFRVVPAKNRDGEYQMGLWLRDGVSGIGTVTFYDPASGVFGALGHGINDVDTGTLLPFDAGSITEARVVDVIPGAAGSPGELCGQYDRETVLGALEKNTDRGIFGTAAGALAGQPIPVAAEDEVELGPAILRSNVAGTEVRDYTVEISRIYHDAEDNRFLLLTVTDPELLRRTGGIVQGM